MVTRAIVAVHYSILVRTQSFLLINNRTELVVTNEVRFIRKQKDMRRSRTTKAISMLQTMYNRETDSGRPIKILISAFILSSGLTSQSVTVTWQEHCGLRIQQMFIEKRKEFPKKSQILLESEGEMMMDKQCPWP